MKKYKTFAEVVRPVKITGLPKFVTVECESVDINFGHEMNMAELKKKYEVLWSYTLQKKEKKDGTHNR